MKIKFLITILLFLTGCAVKSGFVSQPVVITYNSQNHKLNDTAFLYSDSLGRFKLEVYSAAQAVYKLDIGKKVCANGRCMTKAQFNRYELNEHYPENLIVDLMGQKEISNIAGFVEKTDDGFVQKAKNSYFDITYTKTAHGVVFRDTQNKITIGIKGLK